MSHAGLALVLRLAEGANGNCLFLSMATQVRKEDVYDLPARQETAESRGRRCFANRQVTCMGLRLSLGIAWVPYCRPRINKPLCMNLGVPLVLPGFQTTFGGAPTL